MKRWWACGQHAVRPLRCEISSGIEQRKKVDSTFKNASTTPRFDVALTISSERTETVPSQTFSTRPSSINLQSNINIISMVGSTDLPPNSSLFHIAHSTECSHAFLHGYTTIMRSKSFRSRGQHSQSQLFFFARNPTFDFS